MLKVHPGQQYSEQPWKRPYIDEFWIDKFNIECNCTIDLNLLTKNLTPL